MSTGDFSLEEEIEIIHDLTSRFKSKMRLFVTFIGFLITKTLVLINNTLTKFTNLMM
jgi:hypothetical protein